MADTLDFQSPANEPPYSLRLSKTEIAENARSGAVLGRLSANDPDGDDITFDLTDDAGGLFRILGNKIIVSRPLDFETRSSARLTVEATDSEGNSVMRKFTISITDVMETIAGTSKADVLKGGAGADKIMGGAGNDRLFGYGGNDILYGAAGADRLIGGSGADTFVYRSLRDSSPLATRQDTILDFSGKAGDKVDLSAIDADSGKAGDQAFAFIGTLGFTGKAGQLRYEKTAGDTYIYADADGDKTADFVLHLDDAMTLSKGYFVL